MTLKHLHLGFHHQTLTVKAMRAYFISMVEENIFQKMRNSRNIYNIRDFLFIENENNTIPYIHNTLPDVERNLGPVESLRCGPHVRPFLIC